MRPIELLTKAVAAVTETGNLATNVDVSSRDEVGQLGRAFNAMSTKLQFTYATLEQRIAEKTSHLQKGNPCPGTGEQDEIGISG